MLSDEHYTRIWELELASAIAAGDMDTARAFCVWASTQEPLAFDQDNPFQHALRLAVARADNNLAWLEEAEAFLAANASFWPAETESYEAVLSAYHLAGLMRLPEPARATDHFEAALAMCPEFLPAKIELEILRSGRDRAKVFGALGVEAPRNDWAYKLAASELGLTPRPPPLGRPAGAICLRGACTEHTPALVRLYRWLNPTTPIFVATWDDTAPDILAALKDNAQLVLAKDPETPGSQNKNRQIVLAKAALSAVKNADISYVLLLRTDIALFRREIIKNLEAIYRKFPVAPGVFMGRIIICDIFTRKFKAFHFSDILAYGAVPDLIRLWDVPLETTEDYGYTEQYIGISLYTGMKFRYPDTIMNSYYRFLRDVFLVRDFSWFDGCWLKRPKLRTAAAEVFVAACLSQIEWERLYYSPHVSPPDEMGGGDLGVAFEGALGISRL